MEKTIIESTKYDTKKFAITMFKIGLISLVVLFVGLTILGFELWFCTVISLPISAGLIIFGFITHITFFKIRLTVTDKRVFGTALFGKRVDLPLDSISAVGVAWLQTITITTSSGKISFSLIKNSDDLHSEISKLLIERQGKTNETIIKQEIPQSNADELKKFKDLLDSGVITQEEFDEKKKQLLGL